MKLTIQGQGDVTLTQRDFVAAGGQGRVFSLGDTAFKVYTDPAGMMPAGKIRELSVLPVPMFCRPEHLLLDPKGRVVGYTSHFVRNAYVLCQLFPRAFRDREGLTPEKAFRLIEKMREGFKTAHRYGILLIDPNEMNFLVGSNLQDLTFIDTDSYQTRSYPATAIMESIRDRHMVNAHAFNEGTDWFSFAVTSFQVLVGIHPYKGKHPTLHGFDKRMAANISVFNRDVGVPATAYPLDVIPPIWRSWYQAVFEQGERNPPPENAHTMVAFQPVAKTLSGSDNLILETLYQFGNGHITGVWPLGPKLVIATGTGLWVDGRQVSDWTTTVAVGCDPKTLTPVAFRPSGSDIPEVYACQARWPVPFGLAAQRMAGYDGRVYFKVEDQILEGVINDLGGQALVTTRLAATVLPNASLLFPGGVAQNMLGSAYISLFPQSGQTYQVRIPELDTYRVLDARYDGGSRGGVLMVLGRAAPGRYDRLVFRFNPDFTAYDLRTVPDVGPVSPNFVVLDSGVCVCLTENDQIEITRCTLGDPGMKTITNCALSGDSRLYKRGSQVLVTQGYTLYAMRLK